MVDIRQSLLIFSNRRIYDSEGSTISISSDGGSTESSMTTSITTASTSSNEAAGLILPDKATLYQR